MTETIPTTERLALAMEEAGCPAEAIALAREGHYDDFKSSLATPMIQLVNDLRENGYPDLANRAIDGEFDATPEESSAWFEAEGRALLGDRMADIFGGPLLNKPPKPKGFG